MEINENIKKKIEQEKNARFQDKLKERQFYENQKLIQLNQKKVETKQDYNKFINKI